jgi:cell division protein ZapA
MSEVTLLIGGKHYSLACAPGEEERVKRLGAQIDRKLAQLGGNIAASPAQNLVFAALLLADELDEARNGAGGSAPDPMPDPALKESQQTVEQLKLELEALRTEHDEAVRELANARQLAAQQSADTDGEEFAELAEKLAQRLEDCATRLEAAGDAP